MLFLASGRSLECKDFTPGEGVRVRSDVSWLSVGFRLVV